MFKHQIGTSIILIILLITLLPHGSSLVDSSSQTWYVDSSNTIGPWDGTMQHPFLKIQNAINTANSGDTIAVLSGTYNENISIEKSLILQGIGEPQPIIDGKYSQNVIHILHPNITISDFILRNSSGMPKSSGITCDADNILISNCQFYRTRSGVLVNQRKNIIISDCLFHTNGGGVNLQKASKITLDHNDFIHNGLGVNSESSSQITIKDCYATINGIGFFSIIPKIVTFSNQLLSTTMTIKVVSLWKDAKIFSFTIQEFSIMALE